MPVTGWQVWYYRWVECTPSGPRPIPERPCFGAHVFPSRKAAEGYWYDSAPGRNDRMVLVRVMKGDVCR